MKQKLLISCFCLMMIQSMMGCNAQKIQSSEVVITDSALPAAYRTQVYLPLLLNKRVGVFANHTSMVANTHLVDTLIRSGIHVTCIYAPEHGFRGNAEAGAHTSDFVDAKTGIKVISLYGKKLKPVAEDFEDVDLLVFDIQDVGVRFYTYISSLQYFMEAALEHAKPLMILDRPNPNGFYIDGPLLEPPYRSFVGMQPVPVVYGMTIGEYAMMIAGERWLQSEAANKRFDYYRNAENSADTPFHFQLIKCARYTHQSKYQLPVAPSPNLPDMASIYAYPSTCFFEGTNLSEGRGTTSPFRVFGHPDYDKRLYSFTPVANAGAVHPKHENKLCYGWSIQGSPQQVLLTMNNRLQIKYLLEAYKQFPDKDAFFIKPASGMPTDYFFNKLSGNNALLTQLKNGASEDEIRKSWEADIQKFKTIRAKYLYYPE